MPTLAAPDCCMIWCGLHHRVISKAIDHVAWTAVRFLNWQKSARMCVCVYGHIKGSGLHLPPSESEFF